MDRALARARPPAGDDDRAGRDGGDDPRAGARRGRLHARRRRRSCAGVVERCRAHGILFIADEVQTGFGRTGQMFAVEHYGIEPDVICMAKGIASGFPFSALGTRARARRPLADGQPRRDLRRQPDRVRRGAGDDRRHHRARLPRQRARPRRAARRRPARAAAPTTPASCRCAGLGLMVGSRVRRHGRVAAVSRPLPRRGPPDPDERRHLRHASCAGCRRWSSSAAEIDEALGAFGAALKATA